MLRAPRVTHPGGSDIRVCRRAWSVAGVAAALAAVCAANVSAAGGLSKESELRIFTVATGVQFINTADDRARGAANNPFDSATDRLRPKVTSAGTGPGPGDVVVFSFDLYPKAPYKKTIGSASYTCYFNYERHALCQAYYQLPTGTLTAAGPVNFNTTSFTLVITGGTKHWLAARGQVGSSRAGVNAQRVSFRLLR
jgi:hypothetical protein